MKNFFTFSAVCIIASILFSSCGSSISITKRHYNNGYYIAYNNGKQAEPATKTEAEKVAQDKTNDPLCSLKNNAEQNTLGVYSNQSSLTNNNDVVASNEKIQHTSISQKKIKQLLKQKTKINEYPATQMKNILFEPKKINTHEGGGRLSLFWLVILVILILWALGLLVGGFGGLLNILLVLALILFILWLLRFI